MHTYLERKKVVGEAAVETRCGARSVAGRLVEPVERLKTARRGNVERTQAPALQRAAYLQAARSAAHWHGMHLWRLSRILS